jgi:SAM-dependent methyltransferase
VTTSYDTVAYPSALFRQLHPERMAVLATLHGLTPPPPETARYLDIGGGDGMTVIALAAVYPDAYFECFDLAETAVAKFQSLIADAGLTNVKVIVRDVMDARHAYPAASFDYVVTHGVYAWVPEPVRKALLALIEHVLSPDGVAYISYNALPGGHMRRIMRDMLLHEIDGTTDPTDRIDIARAVLTETVERKTPDSASGAAIRSMAQMLLDHPMSVLFHDELGPEFAPQYLGDVAAAAGRHGLRFLSDAIRGQHLCGFLQGDIDDIADPEHEVLRRAQSNDFKDLMFFRETLFVKAAAKPARTINTDMLDNLWVSALVTRNEKGEFVQGSRTVKVTDKKMAAALSALADIEPFREPVAAFFDDPKRRMALLRLYSDWFVDLGTGPHPFARGIGDRPQLSPIIRGQFVRGESIIITLGLVQISITQPELRALLFAADGTRTVDEIAALPGLGFPVEEIRPALEASARRGLLRAR